MINIVGIGVGDRENITLRAMEIIKKSPVVIGAKRQIESIKSLNERAKYIEYIKLPHLIEVIKENINEDMAVIASGEPSLYGIANYIINALKPYDDINIIPGISSIAYLFAKVHLSMNDVYITSFHGRNLNEQMLLISKKTAFFTDDKTSLYEIAQIYLKNKKNPQFIIGENLSYKDEKIYIRYADEIRENEVYKMYVLIAVDK